MRAFHRKLGCMLTLLLAMATALRPFAALAEAEPAAPEASILVYHRFADEATDSMTVRVATFEAHLAWLRAHGYRIVPLRDIVAWIDDPSATLPPKADAHAALLRQRIAAGGGHATLIRASEQVRRDVDVFHPQSPGLASLSERVRNSFDPKRILNRGRLVREGA